MNTMKKMAALLLALLLLLALPACAEQEEKITYQDLKAYMETTAVLNLFDLRSAEVYDAGHIPGAVSFPLDTLRDSIQSILDNGFSYMDTRITVYGETAEEGTAALEILHTLGFTNVAWLESVGAWEDRLISTQEEMDEQLYIMRGLDTVDLYGEKVDSSILAGYRLTMVNVWATYCNPCISEMSDLGRLAREMKEQGVQIVGLISDASDMGTLAPIEKKVSLAKDIVSATGADYPHLMPSLRLAQNILAYVDAVPTTFFVNEDGMIVGELYVGARDYDAWKGIIEDVLNQLP